MHMWQKVWKCNKNWVMLPTELLHFLCVCVLFCFVFFGSWFVQKFLFLGGGGILCVNSSCFFFWFFGGVFCRFYFLWKISFETIWFVFKTKKRKMWKQQYQNLIKILLKYPDRVLFCHVSVERTQMAPG